MSDYLSGELMRSLREKKNLTQAQVAKELGVTAKAVSKWETGRGLPDISLLEPLASALGVSVAELLAGEAVVNGNRSGNIRRSLFHVCPLCGNVVWSQGAGSFSCCGVPMIPQEPEDAEPWITVELSDGQLHVRAEHSMEKGHFVSFIAYVTTDRVELRKLYPQQEAEARFTPAGHGDIYVFCNRHGLYRASW